MRYRVSLIRRGEIEVATVEQLLFFMLRAAFFTAIVSLLCTNLEVPLVSAWASLTQALSMTAH